MGGTSAERNVSLESGEAVLNALISSGVDAEGIDWQGGVPEKLLDGSVDRVFIALHGRGGEDGVIQGMLETIGLPYTGSGVQGSAIAMDKERTKQIWSAIGISTPGFVAPNEKPIVDNVIENLGLPLMVKPAREGSSCGASRVDKKENLLESWHKAKEFDDSILIEQWVTGSEYTVAILNGKALPIIKLVTPRDFYDYEAKYKLDTTEYICPCGLEMDVEKSIQEACLTAFNAVNCSGWGRVDLMIDETGKVYFIEVNTVPGMTSHSLVPMAAKEHGINFEELVVKVLETSL